MKLPKDSICCLPFLIRFLLSLSNCLFFFLFGCNCCCCCWFLFTLWYQNEEYTYMKFIPISVAFRSVAPWHCVYLLSEVCRCCWCYCCCYSCCIVLFHSIRTRNEFAQFDVRKSTVCALFCWFVNACICAKRTMCIVMLVSVSVSPCTYVNKTFARVLRMRVYQQQHHGLHLQLKYVYIYIWDALQRHIRNGRDMSKRRHTARERDRMKYKEEWNTTTATTTTTKKKNTK